MSLISLRNKLNREAVEEDYRANKKVMERQLKQVQVMGEPLRPITSDEAVLGQNIEKFINAFLNKLEQLNLFIPTITEDFGSIRKGKIRRQLAISGFIVDWNAIMDIYKSPSNTENQRTLLASTIQQLQSPLDDTLISIDNVIVLLANFINSEDKAVDNAVINTLIELIKVRSLLNLFSSRLKSRIYKRINESDIKSSYFDFVKNPPIAEAQLREIYATIPSIFQSFMIGKPIQQLTIEQQKLLRQELDDVDEEDESEVGTDPLSKEEKAAANYNMGVPLFEFTPSSEVRQSEEEDEFQEVSSPSTSAPISFEVINQLEEKVNTMRPSALKMRLNKLLRTSTELEAIEKNLIEQRLSIIEKTQKQVRDEAVAKAPSLAKEEVEEEEVPVLPAPPKRTLIKKPAEAGPSKISSDFPFDDATKFNAGEIATLKRYWFNKKDDAGTPYPKNYIESRIFSLQGAPNQTEYIQAQIEALNHNLKTYHNKGSGKLKGMGLYSSRKIVFADGKERPINTRFKHIASPMDYHYERDDPYGNYRLE